MARISSREYERVKPYLTSVFSSSKEYVFFKRYEDEILANLPDIDKIEQNEIDASKEFAKAFMTSWRVHTSLADAISKLIVEGKIPKEDVDVAFKAVEDLRKTAGKDIELAGELALRAHTIENYGLKAHGQYVVENVALPLIITFLGVYLLLKKWKG